jgi:2Fe-2S ferredoxin
MPNITYIEPNGQQIDINLPEGWTLMQGATSNGINGIDAECSGSCACATCHCYVETHGDCLTPPSETEESMLAHVAAERRAESRLSCQIKVTADMDGMVVRLPAMQS